MEIINSSFVCTLFDCMPSSANTGKGAITTFFETPFTFKVPEEYKESNLEMHEILTYRSTPSTLSTNPSIRRERINGEKKEKLPSVY